MIYLAQYVSGKDPNNSQTEDDPTVHFYPTGAELVGRWASIDLRPPNVVEGFALFRTYADLPASPRRTVLSDDPNDTNQTLANRIANRLGFNVDQEPSLRRLIFSLLLKNGDDQNPSRWNALRPTAKRKYEVWLGELMHSIPVIGGGATLVDSFDRADNADMSVGAPYTWTDVANNIGINVNAAKNAVSGVGGCFERCETAVSSANHYCQGTLYLVTSTAGLSGPCCRFAAASQACYIAMAIQSGANWSIRRASGTGVLTSLVSGTPSSAPHGTMCRLECNGSSLHAVLNGVDTLDTTDTTLPTNTLCGIYALGTGGINRQGLQDWQADALSTIAARSFGANIGLGGSSSGQKSFGAGGS